jgi:acyl carrier protein
MDAKEFITEIENLLEMDPGSLSLDTQLVETGKWDSLAFVSFLAIADSQFNARVEPVALRKCQTVGDLMKLIGK